MFRVSPRIEPEISGMIDALTTTPQKRSDMYTVFLFYDFQVFLPVVMINSERNISYGTFCISPAHYVRS